jgi:MarR family transcriptional regulator, 2-MHQ and catechol-resistance regulon repressor
MRNHSTQVPSIPGADPELARDTVALHQALQDLLRVYQFRDRDRICCHDVSVTQCHALEQLVEQGPLSQSELAATLFLDKSTMSRVVSALERKGYLERTADPGDGRAHRLVVTPSGEALVATIEADILEREARLLSDFPSPVRQAMARLVGELARAQGARIDTRGGTCCTLD